MSVLTKAAPIERAGEDLPRRAALALTVFLFPAGYAAVGAFFLLFASAAVALRRSGALWVRTPPDIPLALLVGFFALSAARSPFPGMAAASTVLLALLIALAYGGTVITLTHTAGALLPLLWALGAGTAAAAVWGIITYLVTGQPAHTPALGNNMLGTALATGLPILLGLGVRAVGRSRVLAAAGAAITLVGLALTFSRGAWVGEAVGLLLFIAMMPRRALRPVLLLLAAVILVGGLALANVAGPLERRVESVFAPGAVEDRVAMWHASLAMLRDRPLLGSGLNTFGLVYPRYRLPGDRAPGGQPFAHNIFLNVGAEGGLLGLGAFVASLAAAAVLGVRWLRRAEGVERVAAASVLAAAAGLMAHQQVDGTAISFHIGFGLWLLLGIMASRGSAARTA